jgi:3-phenylpropionate/cinnamic acid dioxygenase small subunit
MSALESPATDSSVEVGVLADRWAAMDLSERIRLQYEVEQFLYAEAALLDARRYRDWLGLVADDIHYWMPIRRTVTIADLDLEFTKPGEMAYFDDDRGLLEMRVRKLEAGSAWSEDPPSRSRHFVSNVRVLEMIGDEISVEAAFHLYRSRLNADEDHWYGRRIDMLRRSQDGFLLARRHLFLDQTVILAANMSTIF